MTRETFENEYVGTSKFYMLRCLISVAHADGIINEDERNYINKLKQRLPLNDEQKQILSDDLERPQDMRYLFKHINDPRYRGQACYFARLMAFKDGKLNASEKVYLDRLHAMATTGLDMPTIRKNARVATHQKMVANDIISDQNKPNGLFGLLDDFLLKLNNKR